MNYTKSNISLVHDCFGCGLCAVSCSKGIINIALNKKGFYEPSIIDESICVKCGICLQVCSYLHDDIALENKIMRSFAGWSNTPKIRHQSSSGGIAYELACICIEKGYKVIAVRYNIKKKRAEHYIASSIDELKESMGSKYIPSFTLEAFRKINRKEKYLVIGTPCQIDSFRRYIKKFRCEDNFILIDLFCHGVPSYDLWKKYLSFIERKTGEIKKVVWRDKTYGWHDSWNMVITGELKQLSSRRTKGDYFYHFFLGNVCLGPQCYDACRFKMHHSSADLRLGDCWGSRFESEKEGVSSVIAFTPKGLELLKEANCTIYELPISVVAEEQMKKTPKRPYYQSIIIKSLQNSHKSIEDAVTLFKRFLFVEILFYRFKHPLLMLRKLYSRIIKDK